MAEEIINGAGGSKISMKVDQNHQAHVVAVTKTETQDALNKDLAYNINTGKIALTSSSESAILYFKNDESPINGESSFVIDAIAIGINNDGTTSQMAEIYVSKNVTGGTIVSGAVDVDMNENRNTGASEELDSLTYKGAEGSTISGGQDVALFFQSSGSRGYYTVDMEVPKGGSVAVRINTYTTAGSTNIYAAIVGHRKDGKNK